MDEKFTIKHYLPYILPAALYALWQTSAGWLNTAWTQARLGDDFTALNFIVFFTAHALSVLLFALRMDKPAAPERMKRLALGSALLTALLTALTAFAGGLWLLLVSVLTGLAAGFFPAFFGAYALRHIPAGHRGRVLAVASAVGLAAHYLLFTLLLHQTAGAILYGKTVLTALVFLLLGLLTLYLPACRDSLWRHAAPDEMEVPAGLGARARLIPPLATVLVLFFVAYGIHDFAATAYWMSGSDFLEHTRLFLIAGFLLCGPLWDRRHGSVLFGVSFGLLALGFIAMALQYKGVASFIGVAGIQLASVFFSLCIRLVFLETAGFFKRPVFTASLGFALPMLLKQAGLLSAAALYGAFGGTALFIVSLVCVALGPPAILFLFERMRVTNVLDVRLRQPFLIGPAEELCPDDPEPDNAEGEDVSADDCREIPVLFGRLSVPIRECGFTRREEQLLELAQRGLTNTELAQRMGISEATIKYHIRNILAKTGAKSLRQLLMLLLEAETEKTPAEKV